MLNRPVERRPARRNAKSGILAAAFAALLLGGTSPAGAQAPTVLGEPVPTSAPQIQMDIAPPDEAGRAAAYARRFRISTDLAMKIIESAKSERLDPELGFRLIRVESVFRTNARGPAGALGLTQLMPSTARGIDRSMRTEAEILEPTNNLRLGFRYLRRLIEKYDGNVRLGLLAYNRGETAVNRSLRAGRDPENGYSPKVLGAGGSTYQGPGLLRD